MSWIKIYDTLPDHPKVIQTANVLKMDKDLFVGKLIRLWAWAVRNREDGTFQADDAETIAEVMRYKDEPNTLVNAMRTAGLFDATEAGLVIHDWMDYAGRLIEQREKHRERERKRYQKSKVFCVDSARRNDAYCDDSANILRAENQAKSKSKSRDISSNEDIITPPYPLTGEHVTETPKKQNTTEKRFDEFWKAYPKKVGKQAALKSWTRIKPDADLHERILAAVETAKNSKQWLNENGRFIPNPATWLNQGRWDDELDTPVTAKEGTRHYDISGFQRAEDIF